MVRKILFVDDDQILRVAIEKRLREELSSFQVLTAIDGFDAVGTLKNHPVSLVVLDLIMPRMDGMSLINHIHVHYPDIPVIIVSGIGEEEVKEIAGNSGSVGYLTKPFLAEDLISMIQKVLSSEAEGGIMYDISPPVFFQLMEMEDKTCTIRILDNKSGEGGIIYFNQGQLIDVRVGEQKGLDAAYQVFSWDHATIFISNRCDATKDSINSTLGPIIMKAAGMKDESEDRAEKYEESDSIASLSDDDDFESGNPVNGHVSVGSDSASDSLNVLRKKLDGISGIESVSNGSEFTETVEQLQQIGEKAGFGDLVMAGFDDAQKNRKILIPTKPAGLADIDTNSSYSVIKEALQKGS